MEGYIRKIWWSLCWRDASRAYNAWAYKHDLCGCGTPRPSASSYVRFPMNREKKVYQNSCAMVYFFFTGWAKSTTAKPRKCGIVTHSPGNTTSARKHTWRKTLLELLSLVWVVYGEGVQIS